MSNTNFNFSFKTVTQKRSSKPKITHNKVIEPDIICVIHIDINGKYYILHRNIKYNLTKNSYIIKNTKDIYAKSLVDNRIIRNIHLQKITASTVTGYLPFAVGNIVKGNIVDEYGVVNFDIKKVITENIEYCEERKEALNFYRQNYEIIQENVRISEQK